jgi:hypothetical protein
MDKKEIKMTTISKEKLLEVINRNTFTDCVVVRNENGELVLRIGTDSGTVTIGLALTDIYLEERTPINYWR